VTEVLYVDGTAQTYRYHAEGMRLEAVNETNTVTFERDLVGNILQETQGEFTVTSEYDALGNRTILSFSLGAHVRYVHDAQGAVDQMKASSWQAQFERDSQGLDTQRTLSGGVRTS
jgi:hypothetical protein